MSILLDQNLPPSLCPLLTHSAGWDVTHVRELGLGKAPDSQVLARAALEGRVLVSADTDFGLLLATSKANRPSVVLLRIGSGRRADRVARLLTTNLPRLAEDITHGAMIVITDQRVRVRRLPMS